ncbi:hypothetical protein H6G33_10140 [Calothrix sp. FACHB-1219]|uniref:hypothetical protein n=1 Tax=unclassified Calothrix TaxID=2619626 RepID=UPI001689869D|nr:MULTISPECIES: hypothetical protein [unclassified Calothrix]MBD2201707.1 hypothetical protein [Calothrix sp. FACHB-168]MBD2217393.1 hypothetical protein [Calothrix sp. FACHB-1219]
MSELKTYEINICYEDTNGRLVLTPYKEFLAANSEEALSHAHNYFYNKYSYVDKERIMFSKAIEIKSTSQSSKYNINLGSVSNIRIGDDFNFM